MKIDVLDKGYVELVDHMGSDLSPVNAARASFMKRSFEFSEADARLVRFLARNDHSCYDSETEVFTDRGWVKWPDVAVDDRLAAVDPQDDHAHLPKMRFEKPLRLVRQLYKGDMYRIKHRDADLLVTPNHRMWIARRSHRGFSSYKFQTAEQVVGKSFRLQTRAILDTLIPSDYSDSLFSIGLKGHDYYEGFLYGMALGDGCRASLNTIRFSLKKQRKINALSDTLRSLCYEYRYTTRADGATVVTVQDNGKYDLPHASEKRIEEWIFAEGFGYRKGVFDGLLQSDGSAKRGASTFSTSSYGLGVDFERLAATVGEYVKPQKSNRDLHVFMVLSRSTRPRINDPGTEGNDSWEAYEGEVFCAEVSTGLLLVRRNGRQVVCGNSPFRHAFVQFEIKAPLMVCRQHWKYVVGSDHTMDGWNEASRRYVTMEPEFYIPTEWRSAPENKKQGSGAPVPRPFADLATAQLEDTISLGLDRYNWALEVGICAEQARGFLPAYFMYTNYWWSTSLQGVMHFLKQRLADDAQLEIQKYAQAIRDLVAPVFPVSLEELTTDE